MGTVLIHDRINYPLFFSFFFNQIHFWRALTGLLQYAFHNGPLQSTGVSLFLARFKTPDLKRGSEKKQQKINDENMFIEVKDILSH